MLEYTLPALGAFVAAAISGAAGFGGALLLLPLLTHVVGPARAVPLLAVAQLVGNLARVATGWRQIDWRSVAWFLCTALPAAVLGAVSFVSLPRALAVRIIGFGLLGLALLQLVHRGRFQGGRGTLLAGGAVTGFISGLIGSAGPLGAAIFLTLGLPPVAYIASEAVTALALHGVKLVVYQSRLALPAEAWVLALGLGAMMILGTWAAKKWIERLPPEKFRLGVVLLLAASAAQMIVTG